jgi:pyruvate/2-oxoglutarate dehydrogenase complex dihydrolipoamide acyltransferase (E2) component
MTRTNRTPSYTDGVPALCEIVLPEIGAGPHPIRVVQWLVDLHSEVLSGERLVEVAATGVLFVVSAPASGILRSQAVGADAIITPGMVLGTIEADDDD